MMKNDDIQKEVNENWARIAAKFNAMQALECEELHKKIDILRKEIGDRELDYCVPVPSYCSPLPPSCCDIGGPLASLNDLYVYPPGVVNALTNPPEPGTPICKEKKE